MKGFWKVLGVIFGIVVTIADLLEFLFLPAVFVLVGILHHLPWVYYLVTVGGYFALMLVMELLMRLVFKALEKKYASRFARKMDKIITRFSNHSENSANLPAEDN